MEYKIFGKFVRLQPTPKYREKISFLMEHGFFDRPQDLLRHLIDAEYHNITNIQIKYGPKRSARSDRLQAREERIQWIRNSSNKEFTAWLKEIEYLPPDELRFNTSAQLGKYYFYDTDAQGQRRYVCEIRHVETGKTSMFDKIEDIDATIRKLIKKKLI